MAPRLRRKPGKIHSILVSSQFTKARALAKAREIADKQITGYMRTDKYHHFILRDKNRFKSMGTKAVTDDVKMRYGALKNPCKPAAVNPKGETMKRLARIFKDFHGFDAGNITQVRMETRIPRDLVQVGVLHEIVYHSDKDNPGRFRRYLHEFDKPYPVLCTDVTGRRLYIVILNSKFKVKPEGLVN